MKLSIKIAANNILPQVNFNAYKNRKM